MVLRFGLNGLDGGGDLEFGPLDPIPNNAEGLGRTEWLGGVFGLDQLGGPKTAGQGAGSKIRSQGRIAGRFGTGRN